MLRKALLATTALVLCASIAYGSQTGVMPKYRPVLAKMLSHAAHALKNAPAVILNTKRGSQPVHNTPPNLANAIFSNYSKDPNAQFISWYGYSVFNQRYYSEGCSGCSFQVVSDNAFPLTAAATVTSKKVTVPLFSSNASAHYEVNIYSSVGGLPGNVIAQSKEFTASDTSLCCTASRTVTIKANLIAGTQYFIGVSGVCCNANGGWNMEDTDFSGAAVDFFRLKEIYTYSYGMYKSTFSSPWHASTYYPEAGAVVLK